MQHVATWQEGDEKWAYHRDAFAQIATHKVSLDPYRLESRRILACIKESLPSALQKVEKASIDEVFLDLSAHVHSILLERHPQLSLPAPYDDPTENLPKPPTTVLDWHADALIDLDSHENEDDDPDWDDVAMLIGSEIVRSVRAAVREKLKYTMSAGVAYNKMLAKLGSAHRKPNQQTIIRNRAIQQFLSDFKFTKIRNLGGKLGDQIVALFATDTVKDLLPVPIEQLKQKLGDDTGTWVYQIIRGNDLSEVNPRTQIKSMLSAKSFRPSINTYEQAVRWVRIFVADIYSRLVEEGVLENKRRPKTINLHHRQGGQTRSRSSPIPQGKTITEGALFDLAKALLGQIIMEGRVWPCANISLSVGGFEDGVTGNMGIGAFLVKGEEALMMNSATRGTPSERPVKKRRVDDGGISRFLVKTESVEEHDDDFGVQQEDADGLVGAGTDHAVPTKTECESMGTADGRYTANGHASSHAPSRPTQGDEKHVPQPTRIADYVCEPCNQAFDSAEALQSHSDWHFARDLQEQDRAMPAAVPPRPPSTTVRKTKTVMPRKAGHSASVSKAEKGQSKLTFGR